VGVCEAVGIALVAVVVCVAQVVENNTDRGGGGGEGRKGTGEKKEKEGEKENETKDGEEENEEEEEQEENAVRKMSWLAEVSVNHRKPFRSTEAISPQFHERPNIRTTSVIGTESFLDGGSSH